MAKAYARMGNEAEMLHALETASEAGMEMQEAMVKDPALVKYVNDPRVVTMARAAKYAAREPAGERNVASVVPALPPAAPPPHRRRRRHRAEGCSLAVGAVAAVGVAAVAALEVVGLGEDQVGTLEVEVLGGEL